MKTRIKHLFVTILLLSTPFLSFDLISQHQYLEAFDEVLIGPDNVNIHLAEQKDYYQAKYNDLVDYIIEIQDKRGHELESIMNDRKKKRKMVDRQEEIKTELQHLNEEENLVYEYMDLWDALEIPEDNIEIDISKCYEIDAQSGVYTNDEYLIINPVSADSISWRECLPWYRVIKQKVMIKPASTKWVKRPGDRDCLSKDPNDCLVWCLKEVPAVYSTRARRVIHEYDGFERTKRDDFIKRISVLRDETLPADRLKILDIDTFYEIDVIVAVLTDCE